MFGGGEDYFAEPEIIDKETLRRFAVFCGKLRKLEKPTKSNIESLCEEGHRVGTTLLASELVVGVVLRHIRSWNGKKQLCYWYLIHHMCKAYPDTFGHFTAMHIIEVACDYIPWENQELSGKYESLVSNWDEIFPKHILDAVHQGKKDRLEAVRNPKEAIRRKEEEEETWNREEAQYTEQDGLNDYGQPCLAYLQGRCPWKNECTLLHPEGMEGSLPEECRAGDWRCMGCGTINRHFRRRCTTCPREKPQYRRAAQKAPEELALSHPDADLDTLRREQFGYDTNSIEECVNFFTAKVLASGGTEKFLQERRVRYLTRIMGYSAQSALDAIASNPKVSQDSTAASSLNLVEISRLSGSYNWKSSEPQSTFFKKYQLASGLSQKAARNKRARTVQATVQAPSSADVGIRLPTLPPMPPVDRMLYICHQLLEKGVQDNDFPGYLFLFCQTIPEACQDVRFTVAMAPSDLKRALMTTVQMVFTNWNIQKNPAHPAVPFFADLRRYMSFLPIEPAHKLDVAKMADKRAQPILSNSPLDCGKKGEKTMAKIGEGDPRWIVAERPDGANVNNWHWEEKDLSSASHEHFKNTFKGMALCSDPTGTLSVTIKEASEVDGDVTVAQRKGKIMCYFEVKMTLKFKGKKEGSDDKIEGKITIPDVEHDNFEDDFEIRVAESEKNKSCEEAANLVRSQGRTAIRQVVRDYFNSVFQKYKVGHKVSKGDGPPTPLEKKPTGSAYSTPPPAKPAAPPAASAGSQQTSFTWKMEWKAPVEEMWNTLTQGDRASVYTRAPARIDPRPSGTFEFLGGVISGYYVDVQYPEKLTMQWRLSSWKSGVHSTVVIMLSKEERGVTRMEFAHAGIPDGEIDRVKQGWEINFWDPIKVVFGFHYEYL